jgi:hypothetical protein
LSTRWRKPCAKKKGETQLARFPQPARSRGGRQQAKLKPDPTLEEGEGTREKENQIATASRAAGIKEEVYLQKPGGKRSKGKRPEAWSRRVRRTGPWRYQGQGESLLRQGQREAKLSKPRKKPKRVW